MRLEIKFEDKEFRRIMDDKRLRRVYRNTIDVLARRARKVAISEIQKLYTVGADKTSKRAQNASIRIRVDKTTAKRPDAAYLFASKRRMRLASFRVDETPTGVRVEVEKGKAVEIAHAFIATPSGRDWAERGQTKSKAPQYRMVFIRGSAFFAAPKGKKMPYKIWQPLEPKVSQAKMLTDPRVQSSIYQMIKDDYATVYAEKFNDGLKKAICKPTRTKKLRKGLEDYMSELL